MREDVVRRYHHLHDIITRHCEGALDHVSAPTLLEHARRLGLDQIELLVSEKIGHSTLVFDLAIFTARDGRSRAIDRYARNTRPPPESDEARVLDAMCRARFSIWRIERRHETAGVIASDLLRGGEAWLLEPIFEDDCEGCTIAARLCEPDGFALTCGIALPVDSAMLDEAAADPLAFRHPDPERIANDPRFVSAIYKAALDLGVIDVLEAGDAAETEEAERTAAKGRSTAPLADAAA
jgi:hypothetical protein